jgi:iron complex outermembrane receptor protein
LINTAIRTHDVAIGISRVWDAGFAGAAVSDYRSRYGIPGGFLGGHPRGVDIDLQRHRFEGRVGQQLTQGPVERLELIGTYSRYYHVELESGGTPGVSFGLLTYSLATRLHWKWPATNSSGVAGVSGEYRDYQSGYLTFTPPTIERAGAVFGYQKWTSGPFELRGGLRADARWVMPAFQDTNKSGIVRQRRFAGVSAGASVDWTRSPTLALNLSVMRSFKAPSLEDLFAEGPHLAAYSYEIGNADLASEHGLGWNVTARFGTGATYGSVSAFVNDFGSFIYSRNTGLLEIGPGAEGFLERYRFTGAPVRMTGAEAAWVAPLLREWSLEGNASFVRGTLRDDDAPLPAMPPAQGRLTLRWKRNAWDLHATIEGAAAQRRLGEFERSTASYATLDVAGQWSRSSERGQQSIVLSVSNVTDTLYRDHLSRIKDVMPEPGRNVRLLVRSQF